MKKIYEGKAKIIFATQNTNEVIQFFKDDITAFNKVKKDKINKKGFLNNVISEFLMKKISDNSIPTHFIKRISDNEQLIKKANIIPLEVVIRNIAAGSIVKKLNIKKGEKFSEPIFEIFYKDDSLGDPLINEDHAVKILKIINKENLEIIKNYAFKINEILKKIFFDINLTLVDFKIEFGLDSNQNIMLADEISPDSCRLWQEGSMESFDKDRFREGLGDVIKYYSEIANRLGLIKT
jgi:phosphoribosylaminoimidazole-succinocarboxamide synthase